MTRRRGRAPAIASGDAVARLAARWQDVRRRLDEARFAALDQPGRDADAWINALLGKSIALEHLLVRTPATGPAGIEAKIDVALTLLRDVSARDSIHYRLLASALRDLRKQLGR
jgi:hypothetical protein